MVFWEDKKWTLTFSSENSHGEEASIRMHDNGDHLVVLVFLNVIVYFYEICSHFNAIFSLQQCSGLAELHSNTMTFYLPDANVETLLGLYFCFAVSAAGSASH